MNITIDYAYEKLDIIRTLFKEYAQSLGIDLQFQAFEKELANLPDKYALEDGRLYIAYVDGEIAGCVGLRRFDANRCELKRLYIREKYRHLGLGQQLSLKVIDDARQIGYQQILLDTLSTMTPAMNLYRKLGFRQIAAYYNNPIREAVYFGLDLFPKDS
ncbi:MAG: GNAT family N-acetyltransferase [Firmicutes bacterium HGW-Firmicutes-20]|nr:MAG: GNAT family N-acetyltransferase [Firmicutes bacterium HGW-Firmicutes-20]PKM69843.1 MAG: GNAT family N-acetyltransferase [Firmicutes bacterium HGW-Firmicutes-19]